MSRARPNPGEHVAAPAGGHRPEHAFPELGPERRSSDKTTRRIYLLVLTLSMLSLLTTSLIDGLETPYWGIVYPLLGVYNLALLPAIRWRRLSLRAIETLLLIPVVVALVGFLATWRFAPRFVDGGPEEVVLVVLWTAVTFPLCFLVFGTRRGLWASLAIYASAFVLTAPILLDSDPGQSVAWARALLRSTAYLFPMLIALIRVMASRLEELISARAQAATHAHEAHTDSLTDLPNRRRLDDELDRHRALAQRHDQPLSVVLIDLDHFKVVNDQLGHDVGDQVLVAVARRLSASVRGGDLVGRWGGEEFLLIAPHTDHSAALVVAERCRAKIADRPFRTAGQLTASFGVATLAPDDDVRALLRRADLALYTAKTDGRNRVATMLELAPPHDPRWAPKSDSCPPSE